MKRFRGVLVFKAHRLVYHSTLGWRVIKKKVQGLRRMVRVVNSKCLELVREGSLLNPFRPISSACKQNKSKPKIEINQKPNPTHPKVD